VERQVFERVMSGMSRHALIGLSLHCKPTTVILYLVPVLHPTRIDINFMEPAMVLADVILELPSEQSYVPSTYLGF
jgi:hypothetical protein